MSDILYKMFCEKFPPTPRRVPRVSIYPPNGGESWIERIHLNLIEKIFIDRDRKEPPLLESKDIDCLAEKIFDDINYEFYEQQEEGNVIDFSPEGIDDYTQNYMGHYIAVHEPLRIPRITISTGNRGSIGLHKRQREKYFQFVDELYGIFLKKAKE